VITRVGMAPRAAGLTRKAFQEHWRSRHAGEAARLPGLRGYIQNHAVLDRDGEPLLRPVPPFDACSEIDFDDIPAMEAAFASELYRGAVAQDEREFIDRTGFLLLLTERIVLNDVAPAPYKLLTFGEASHDLPPTAERHEVLEAIADGPWPRIDIRHLAAPGDAPKIPGAMQLIARPLRVA
jgi:uncharacterized protein (TIGR02118 family)